MGNKNQVKKRIFYLILAIKCRLTPLLVHKPRWQKVKEFARSGEWKWVS